MAFAMLPTDNRRLYPIHLSKSILQSMTVILAIAESWSLTISCVKFGGGERARTDDLLRAKQVLSQLSYTPQ